MYANWPNLRSRTMTKIDQSNKTGAQGGTESKLDDTDKLVIEIIRKESPVVQGIAVPDSMETVSEVKDITEDLSYSMPNENDDNGTTKSKCSLQQSSCRRSISLAEVGPSQQHEGEISSIDSYVQPSTSLSKPSSDFSNNKREINVSGASEIQVPGHEKRAYEDYEDFSEDPNVKKRKTDILKIREISASNLKSKLKKCFSQDWGPRL
ncbi:unnamed protein product [Psylliodes chrysocephalus]|uniref:Uncharacterized protein n=1 Tax=Psylliodes chrysocephalus TaxID=3402493 RepID=A0A9P0CP05_9CUCU|nr:unnamed protein product [Psylliodes chrysocephala]